MARTSNFANIATVTRASKKTDAGGWDFTNGGTVGTLTEYDNNVAAIHGTAGLLGEEATTNDIRNPRCEGAVAGTPGTPPTNWIVGGTGFSQETVGAGTEDGWPYVDIRVYGTPASFPFIYTETATAIPGVNGETFTFSAGLRIVGGDLTNVAGVRFNFVENNSGGGTVKGNPQDFLNVDSTHKRWFSTETLSGTGTAYVAPRIDISWVSGAIDITLRIYAPQIEQKAFPTSPVFPTVGAPAASTRAADDVAIPASAWLGTSHTVYVSAQPGVISGSVDSTLFSLSAQTGNDRIVSRYDAGTGSIEGLVVIGGSTVATSLGSSPGVVGTVQKVALALAQDDYAFSATGETQDTDSSTGALFTPTELQIGAAYNNTLHFNGYIKDVRYWPRRLSNAELEALVGN